MASYTPDGGTELGFGLLVAGSGRQTQEQFAERVYPGADGSAISHLGKRVSKIQGQARIDGFPALKTFEGAVGTTGTLVYSEEPDGVEVVLVGLTRTRVTPSDMHMCDIEFWLTPSGVRRVTLEATATTSSGDVPIGNLISGSVSFGFTMRTSECRLVTPIRPTGITYDDVLTVTMGAGHNVSRFTGLVRDFLYQDGTTSCTTVARGFLTRAIEYENWETTTYSPWTGVGGLLIHDLVGSIEGASADIVMAVLDKANVPYDPAHIGGSRVNYGSGVFPTPFLWSSGSHIQSGEVYQPSDAGESALDYIEKYDNVDAEVSGASGGRYRTFETMAGDVYRARVGGRPQGTPDYILTEGVDILAGNFTRSIAQTRNYFIVHGQDRGAGFGPLSFALQEENDFQPATTKHTFAFSSDMIERANNGTGADQAPDGMSCETLANALAMEFNREVVSGWVETFRDDEFGVAQTHLVQGGSGGTVGALGLAENVWVQSLEISVDERGFTQRLSYLGGGLPDPSPDPLLVRAIGRERRQAST